MRWCLSRSLALLFLATLAARVPADASASIPSPATHKIDFRSEIYPILKDHCFQCHQGSSPSSGIRLDLRAELTGENSGKPLVEVNQSSKSRLILLVAGKVPGKIMPARGPRLSAVQVGLLRAWIDQGLAWDERLLPPLERTAKHWAFQPVQRPDVPTVKDKTLVRNPIDAFIVAAKEVRGLQPVPEATRAILLRRLTLDLTGLPPTPAEVDAFLADRTPQAYDRLVERLLASPAYGERWGRHWLDVVRWADSEGYESDHIRPFAWRYRDYVVRSFNADKPYDRFLREQLAGDEITPYSDENLIATGFLASARLSSNEEDKARQRNDILVDIVNATASTVLGLTMNCAQCHSHKFDPISARDYYRFQGFFIQGAPNNLALRDPAGWKAYRAVKPPEYDAAVRLKQILHDQARDQLLRERRAKLTPAQGSALATPEEKRSAEQQRLAREADLLLQILESQIEKAIPETDRPLYDELKKKITALEKQMVDKPQTFGFYSPVSSPHKVEMLPMKGFYPPPYHPEELARARPYLLRSGEVHERGPAVEVGWPAVFGPTPSAKVEKHPRTALVDWLVQPNHPLTARVWVNRIWQYHFGRGLVATPNDFGFRGARPSHPELLDWLASELIRSGWSTKHIHRLIVGSNTYRQSSRMNPINKERDPENRYLWRWTVRRLEVEAIRDGLLAVSGELDRTCGGPSIVDDPRVVRRTLYLLQKRQKAPAVQGLFDGPTGATESCPKRALSTVPLQALYLLNNEFSVLRARALAAKVRHEAGDHTERQITVAMRRVLGRAPDDEERSAARAFFQATSRETESALIPYCQALFNLNEFLYLE